MAKKATMTLEERESYLDACDDAITRVAGKICAMKSFEWEAFDPEHWYSTRKILLRRDFKRALDVIQTPKETSDYSQTHLKLWREMVRELDYIIELYRLTKILKP